MNKLIWKFVALSVLQSARVMCSDCDDKSGRELREIVRVVAICSSQESLETVQDLGWEKKPNYLHKEYYEKRVISSSGLMSTFIAFSQQEKSEGGRRKIEIPTMIARRSKDSLVLSKNSSFASTASSDNRRGSSPKNQEGSIYGVITTSDDGDSVWL